MSGKPLTCLVSMFFSPFLTHSINHPYSQLSQQHRGDSSSQVRAFGRYYFILLSALYCLYKTRTDTLLFTPTRWSEYYVILVSMPHILYSYFSHIHPIFIPTVNILPMRNATSIQASSGDVLIIPARSAVIDFNRVKHKFLSVACDGVHSRYHYQILICNLSLFLSLTAHVVRLLLGMNS